MEVTTASPPLPEGGEVQLEAVVASDGGHYGLTPPHPLPEGGEVQLEAVVASDGGHYGLRSLHSSC